jgi:hypothetical protein
MNLDLKQKVAIRTAVLQQLKSGLTYEELVGEVCRLRFRVAELEKDNSDMGWQLNPDRMGGSFSQDEIDNTGWK